MVPARLLQHPDVGGDAVPQGGEGSPVAGAPQLREVGLGVGLVAPLEVRRERYRAHARALVVGGHFLGQGLEALGPAGPAVEHAAHVGILQQEQVHRHRVVHVDEVAAEVAGALEDPQLAALGDLVVELVDDRGHAPLVVLLRTVHVEVPQTGDLGRCDRVHPTHVAVEQDLREGVDVQRALAGRLLAKAVVSVAVDGGGRGVEERATTEGEGEQSLRVLVVDAQHEAPVAFDRVRTGALVEDRLDRRRLALGELLDEVAVVDVVGEAQRPEPEVLVPVLEVVDDQDVLVPGLVQAADEVAADEAGASGDDDHAGSTPGDEAGSRSEDTGPSAGSASPARSISSRGARSSGKSVGVSR